MTDRVRVPSRCPRCCVAWIVALQELALRYSAATGGWYVVGVCPRCKYEERL